LICSDTLVTLVLKLKKEQSNYWMTKLQMGILVLPKAHTCM